MNYQGWYGAFRVQLSRTGKEGKMDKLRASNLRLDGGHPANWTKRLPSKGTEGREFACG